MNKTRCCTYVREDLPINLFGGVGMQYSNKIGLIMDPLDLSDNGQIYAAAPKDMYSDCNSEFCEKDQEQCAKYGGQFAPNKYQKYAGRTEKSGLDAIYKAMSNYKSNKNRKLNVLTYNEVIADLTINSLMGYFIVVSDVVEITQYEWVFPKIRKDSFTALLVLKQSGDKLAKKSLPIFFYWLTKDGNVDIRQFNDIYPIDYDELYEKCIKNNNSEIIETEEQEIWAAQYRSLYDE